MLRLPAYVLDGFSLPLRCISRGSYTRTNRFSSSRLYQSISTLLRSLTPPQQVSSPPSLLALDPEPLLHLTASAARLSLSSIWLSLAETLLGRLAPPMGFADAFSPESQRVQGLVREVSTVLLMSGVSEGGEEGMKENPDLVEGLFKFASAVSHQRSSRSSPSG
jgi:hypothetical protein